jgi:hypothetical protein
MLTPTMKGAKYSYKARTRRPRSGARDSVVPGVRGWQGYAWWLA